jgi:hypothetical protein
VSTGTKEHIKTPICGQTKERRTSAVKVGCLTPDFYKFDIKFSVFCALGLFVTESHLFSNSDIRGLVLCSPAFAWAKSMPFGVAVIFGANDHHICATHTNGGEYLLLFRDTMVHHQLFRQIWSKECHEAPASSCAKP